MKYVSAVGKWLKNKQNALNPSSSPPYLPPKINTALYVFMRYSHVFTLTWHSDTTILWICSIVCPEI